MANDSSRRSAGLLSIQSIALAFLPLTFRFRRLAALKVKGRQGPIELFWIDPFERRINLYPIDLFDKSPILGEQLGVFPLQDLVRTSKRLLTVAARQIAKGRWSLR